jgi:hypothetical protein
MSLLVAESQSTFGQVQVYCDFSRKNFRPTVVGTVTETWPALVTAGCTAGVATVKA